MPNTDKTRCCVSNTDKTRCCVCESEDHKELRFTQDFLHWESPGQRNEHDLESFIQLDSEVETFASKRRYGIVAFAIDKDAERIDRVRGLVSVHEIIVCPDWKEGYMLVDFDQVELAARGHGTGEWVETEDLATTRKLSKSPLE